MSNLAYKHDYRRHLPHIQPPGASLFVTFRLVGSIPNVFLEELRKEAIHIDFLLNCIVDKRDRVLRAEREHKRLFARWDDYLDATTDGPHWLKEPEVAQLVCKSLHYRDGDVYDLDTFCIMSNHGHLLFTPLEEGNGRYHSLSSIMHSLKIYTALNANNILGREGQFWQHESYDHFVRNEKERKRIRQYILNNPVKAGLVEFWDEWPWAYCKYP